MTYTPEELAEMSGEASYRSGQRLELNEILINGDGGITPNKDGSFSIKGGYFRKRILVGRVNRDEKPEEVNLGPEIKVVFLKIRRKLVERAKGGEIVRSTSEHNTKTDSVVLYQQPENEYGVAEDLRKKYVNLRTVQLVYALLLDGTREPELVRLVVRGASLGSEAKPEGVLDFYRYISSFPKEEHLWQFVTELGTVREEGQQAYYAINFQKGERLDPEMEAYAVAQMKMVHDSCKAADLARSAKIVDRGAPAPTESDTVDLDELDEAAEELPSDEPPF